MARCGTVGRLREGHDRSLDQFALPANVYGPVLCARRENASVPLGTYLSFALYPSNLPLAGFLSCSSSSLLFSRDMISGGDMISSRTDLQHFAAGAGDPLVFFQCLMQVGYRAEEVCTYSTVQ